MNRRSLVLATLSLPLLPRIVFAAPSRMTVYRSPTCGCCGAWIEHVRVAGYDVTTIEIDQEELRQEKLARGVPEALASCHTAAIEGYTLEGHVPVEDIARLLSEQPAGLGLAVPGMPAGSPGMDMADRRDAFDVILFDADGDTRVFSSYS